MLHERKGDISCMKRPLAICHSVFARMLWSRSLNAGLLAGCGSELEDSWSALQLDCAKEAVKGRA